MNEVRIVGNDVIISVDEVVANMENAALIEDNKRLQSENAKLRELCGDLYHELYAARDEHWPASYLGDLEPRDVFPRYDELIELGVDA